MKLKMGFKFGSDRRNDWRCCFCCHVRTGTIFLGVWHLILHIFALSIIAIILRYPEVIIDYDENNFGEDNLAINHKNKLALAPALPTPLSSEVGPNGIEMLSGEGPHVELDINVESGEQVRLERILIGRVSSVTEQPEPKLPKEMGEDLFDKPPKKYNTFTTNAAFRDIFGTRSISNHDLNTGVVVTFCTFIITLLMVYGALRNKPSYLMPFFCLQVFDFCIACLTAVGYLCYLPDVRRLVSESRHIPYATQLQQLNPQCLSLLLMLAFVTAMAMKAYFIGVVWRCYKYLSLRRVAQLRTVHFIDSPPETLGAAVAPDSPLSHQEALLLLPDYETAVNDPRYALNGKVEKKPLGFDSLVLMAPPPAYSSVMQDSNQVVPEETVEVIPEVASNERIVPASPGATPTHEVGAVGGAVGGSEGNDSKTTT